MPLPRAALAVAGEREQNCVCPVCAAEVRLGEPIAVCPACGSVHHATCWEKDAECGSYACAPARRAVPAGVLAGVRITPDDLAQALPLPTRPSPRLILPVATSQPMPSTSRLAWAALLTALAGIPFFGALTGLVAVLLGSLALGQIQHTQQRGTGLALSGILLGLADAVAWIVFLGVMLTRPTSHVPIDFALDEAALKDLDPAYRRAFQGNAWIESARGPLGRGTAVGSGVVLRLAGGEALLVSNRHVVDPNYSGTGSPAGDPSQLPAVEVQLLGQGPRPGRVVWLAPHGLDLALLRVPCSSAEVQAVRWRRDRPVQIGQTVFAVGNPRGLGWTHTQGVVSQMRRQRADGFEARIIQTQAALNPGNSGGGLFDREGYLVGINTWIHDHRESEGIGFAIAFESFLALQPEGLGEAGEPGEGR